MLTAEREKELRKLCSTEMRDAIAEIDRLRDIHEEREKLLDELTEKIADSKKALKSGLKGLVWFLEGPYGESPCMADLLIVKKTLRELDSR